MSPRGSIHSPRAQPHITLNSGNQDLLMTETLSSPLGTVRPDSSRLVLGQPRPSPSPSPPPPSRQHLPPGSSELYGSVANVESAEYLLPPSRSRTHRSRADDPSSFPSTISSSRRTSWASDIGAREDRIGPFASPFDDSRAPSRAGSSDDEHVNTQTVSDKYTITPSAGLLLFPEDVEKDDWLHNPDPNEKEKRECDIFTRRGVVNVGGLALIVLGLLVLFIGYPVLTFTRSLADPSASICRKSAACIDVGPVPLLKNVRRSLIDPDTPASARTKTGADGTKLNLVFSDEFNTPGRTFYDGDDPYWQAVDLWYGVTEDLEWYDPDAVTTKAGVLEIRFDAFQSHGLNYRSGMVQSWNKMCFKGGLMEASMSLPGSGEVSGFWPGIWTMGNLGRPGYASTTDGLWPYSYWNKCDLGITKNQSSTDGISSLPGMRLPACTCSGQDHPTPGKSRSAPEIDALEASVGHLGPGRPLGSVSQSFQLAPFDIWYQPNYDFVELYDPSITSMNGYRGGVYQQALSAVTNLNNDWYDGKQYQTYAFEYQPGETGSVVWYVGDKKTWKLDGRAIGPNGNIGHRVIPEEPMSVVMNLGMGQSFAMVDFPNLTKLLPATMRFDYIRIYQDSDHQLVTCDPPGYETTAYINDHLNSYHNPNKTTWESASHPWPKNSFVDGC